MHFSTLERLARKLSPLLMLCLAAVLSSCALGGQSFSSASGTGSGGVITVPPPPVMISISPSAASVAPNGTVNFSVNVSNTTNQGVTFSVNGVPGGNTTVGTIGSGNQQSMAGGVPPATYVAPATVPTPSTVMVTATSNADPSVSATALVVISTAPTPITITVNPPNQTVAPGLMSQFTAAVSGTTNTAVTWSVNNISGGNSTVGTISQTGLYTAPLAAPNPPSVTITATSLADPTASGSSAVTIQQAVSITVAPTTANVVTAAQFNFTATVTGSVNTNVLWSVAGIVGGNAIVGTINTATGIYTAPALVPTPATVTVTATSQADPTKFATAQVTILAPGQVAVSVAPAMTSLAALGSQMFTANVTGAANTVTWSVCIATGPAPFTVPGPAGGTMCFPGGSATVGTVSAAGLYVAPGAIPFPNTVTVTATSTVQPLAMGTAAVQLLGPGTVNVTVAPAAATIQTGNTQQFTATVTGTSNTAVIWTVNNLPGGNAAIGTISNTGLYTAPAAVPSPATVTIAATSMASPSSSGTAMLTVSAVPPPVTVNVMPGMANLKVTNMAQFSATVSGAPAGQMGVNWSVNGIPGGNTTFGFITPAGLYTAPASVPTPATFNITATSQFQNTASASASITILPQISISISPTMASVQAGLLMQFTVIVSGTTNTAVNFTVNNVAGGNSTFGTVDMNGLYTAPSTVPSPATVTLKATSVADPTLMAIAMITIDPPVTVMVSPPSPSIAEGAVQQFMATVTGTANTAVNWTVNGVPPPGNSTVGMITAMGQYTAPTNLLFTTTFTVTATSQANPSAQASAQVTVNVPISVTVAPNMATVVTGAMQAFSANVSGTTNMAVNWSVGGTPNPGSISSTGVYMAPPVVPAGNVTITATSQADPTKMGTATVTVVMPVSVMLAPTNPSVNTGATQLFTPTVLPPNTPNKAVTWTVNGIPNGNINTVGAINPATGLYTAPSTLPAPPMVTVTATSVQDPTKFASTTVTITPVVTAISVSPPTPSIATSATQQFVATVTGTGNLAVTWEVNGTPGGNINTVGSISPTGLYTAPSFSVVTMATMFTVTARSVQNNTVTGNAMVTVTPPPIVVNVSPDPVTVTVNGTQQFTVMVSNAANPAVNWTVNGQFPGNIATIGTITAGGLYTAPASPPASQPLIIQATSVQDPSKSDTAMLTVVAAEAITVAPAKTKVVVGQQQQFTATVTACPTTCPIMWTVVGGPVNGMISNTGLYTAPPAVPVSPVVTIMASDTNHPGASGTTTTTILPAINVSVAPTPINLNAGGAAQQFTATVTGTANTAVTWFVNGVLGGNNTVGIVSPTGLYTPPGAVPNPATVMVTAVSQADPTKSGSAMVNIMGVISVSVTPMTPSVNVNTSQQFTATVMNAPNNVTWSISGTGNIGSIGMLTGLYNAPPNVPSPATVTVTATAMPSGTVGMTTLTVEPVVSVTISPMTMTVTANQIVQFTATVLGTPNTAVTWSVNGIPSGNSSIGTVSATGLYTAPAVVPASPVVSVTATSVADVTKSATAAVTITAPSAGIFVIVFPRNELIPIGRPQQFRAHVILSSNPAVNWMVNNIPGGNNTVGTIDSTGLYTPPTILPSPPGITVTAQSQADPTKSDTQNATLVAGVTLTPASDSLHVNESVPFSATVTGVGVASTAVTWAVNGVVGGNSTLGTIDTNGKYTAPATVPVPGMVEISATSVTDPTLPGLANMTIYPTRYMKVFPTTVSVLPGWRVIFQYSTNVYFPPTKNQFSALVNWSVNGVVGGNASVGTITNYGLYTAPLTPQTVTVAVQSLINPAFTASATVMVTSAAGVSSDTLLDTLTKPRPYDVITTGSNMINLAAAQQEYADWQVLVTANGEDLSGVDVTVSDFVGTGGNRISASNAMIYYEKMLNAFYISRLQGSDVGEWPDPLVPKVDPFFGEVRNVFPFTLNRISPVYKQYPLTAAANTTNTGVGAGTAQSGGTFTGTVHKRFDVIIDSAGAVGTATFKWTTDGGATFQASGVQTSLLPTLLSEGVTIAFQPSALPGLAQFNVGDTFSIFAGPLRNQPVWIDLYVPMGTPAGNYTGTVTVTKTGKPATALTVNLQVYNFAIPVSSSFPVYISSYWPGYVQAHFNIPFGPQTDSLGQLYGTACLINRLSCDGTGSGSTITFNPNGSVATFDPTAYDQAIGPLLDGNTPPNNCIARLACHGEQWTTFRLTLLGNNDSQQYFSTQTQLAHFVAKGWRSRLFDYTRDEPHLPVDFISGMDRASLLRGVDNTIRTLSTTVVSSFNYNFIGYINRWVPNWTVIGLKDYQRGPAPIYRANFDQVVANGDDIWWYDSCSTQGCSRPGTVPLQDNYPNSMMDTPALQNRVWGYMSLIPYRVGGVLYYDSSFAFGQSFNMSNPKFDVWDSIFYFGGNGDGSFFYPGRPVALPGLNPSSGIGGVHDIPIESVRMKQDRDALVDIEYGLKLQAQGDANFYATQVLQAAQDLYTYDANTATWLALRKTLGMRIK